MLQTASVEVILILPLRLPCKMHHISETIMPDQAAACILKVQLKPPKDITQFMNFISEASMNTL
jgi:hypothetical protein